MPYSILFLLLPLTLFAAVDQKEITRSNELYESAVALIQSGDKSKRPEIIEQLKQAKELLVKQGELPPEIEEQLVKINSHIYWQNKFSTTEDLKVKVEKKKKSEPNDKEKQENVGDAFRKESYQRWLKEKEQREKMFKTSMQEAQHYEEKFSNDVQSNLLNFLDLQLKVVDPKNGMELLNKAKLYYQKIADEDKALLEKVTSSIGQYQKLLASKDYETLFSELTRKLQYGSYDNKTKQVLRQYALEIQAMNNMKSRLMSSINAKNSIAVPSSLIEDYEGVISKVTQSGIELLSAKGMKSEIGWGVINENVICSLSLKFMDQNNANDLFMLVVSSLRLKEYEPAFEYLNSLMKLDNKNYLRYRDFLAQCETGYRLKYGELFEKAFSRVEELSVSGQTNQAYQVMNELMDNYLNSPLGRSYVDRFMFIYNGILRV